MVDGIERLTPEEQEANAWVYRTWDRVGIDDGWQIEFKTYNFERLAFIEKDAGIPLHGASILDVGCGTGDFFPFLKERGVGEYLGVDLLSSSVEKARVKYPEGAFRQADFLVEPQGEKFDYVFCSGGLSSRLPSDRYEFIEKMIRRMWELSKVGIAFNYITNEDDPYSLVFSYDRDIVVDICRRIAPFAHTSDESAVITGGASIDTYQETLLMWR